MTATLDTSTAPNELATEAFALVDRAISDLRGVTMANAQEMTDVLLDLRILLARITEGG